MHKIINIKLDQNENIEEEIRNVLKNINFKRYKYRIRAGIEYLNAKQEIFFKWSISGWYYNHESFVFSNWEHQIENEELEGSGFSKQFVKEIQVEVYKIKDIKASSYVELPKKYKNCKSIINIQNDDQFCFIWSILAYLYPPKSNVCKVYNYKPYINNFNLKNLEFPMSIGNIPKFENQNNLCINVFELQTDTLIPVYVNKNYSKPQIDLLLFDNHYCLITHIQRLLTDNRNLNFVCRRCLNVFGTQIILDCHIEMCQNMEPCRIDFPKNNYLNFHSYHTKIDIPIRVYADFECFNIPNFEQQSDKTKILFTHSPCSVVYYLISPWFEGYKSHSGEMCVKLFVDEMFELEKKAVEYYLTNLPLEMSEKDENDFKNSDVCWLCDKKFLECQNKNNREMCLQNCKNTECKKVRDHDHLTGKFRGAAHKNCNLQTKQDKSNFVPILMHNFSGYDCHLIFEHLLNSAQQKGFDINKIKIIPKSIENFICLQIGSLRFLDSYRFLPSSSLDNLAKSLSDFPILKKNKLDDPLLVKKLAYAYEYFNESNFKKPLNLKKEDFWSTLKQKYPPEKKLIRTFEIIDKYNLRSGKDLTLMYNLLDVLILADVFENFIQKCLKFYKINPLYCYSSHLVYI